MIQINQLDLQRSGKPLFEHANLTIHPGQRFALTGNNGTGKSSLFQVILGELDYDAGDVFIPSQWRIAHMAQELETLDRAAVDYVIDGFKRLRALEAALTKAESEHDNNAIVAIHGELDTLDAYNMQYKAESILQGLGFSNTDYNRSAGEFSGGWRIRLNLARALLAPSDLLLLDEPTNHLDLDAIYWLEQWLKNYEGAVLLISHDRDFIDNSVNHIAHIANHQISTYSGSYSDFERQRAEKLNQQQALHVKQQTQMQHMQSYIDRFRAQASKAKQAQSRIKALERMQLVSAVRAASEYQFRIPHADKTGSPLINWFEVDLGYSTIPLLHKCSFSILPGMRIGLLGENGAGKSTLLKTLVGDLPAIHGEIIHSEHLRIGYFAQHQLEALDMNSSPILHLQRLSPDATEQKIRDFLGRYLIKGDMAKGTIEHFSGGEKARLALAIVAWKKPNLLILDEPTNHLDISMREALADAIQEFEGAVILVSHDRYMLRHCIEDFWLVAEGKVTPFEGDLEDYHQLKARTDKTRKKQEKSGDKKQKRQDTANNRAQITPITKRIKQIEKELSKAQDKLEKAREALTDSTLYDAENKNQLQKALAIEKQLQQSVEALEEQWLEQEELLQDLQ